MTELSRAFSCGFADRAVAGDRPQTAMACPTVIGLSMCRLPLFVVLCALASAAENPAVINLHDGWTIQPAVDVHENGENVSQPGYKTRDWYRARVPSTVFSALV